MTSFFKSIRRRMQSVPRTIRRTQRGKQTNAATTKNSPSSTHGSILARRQSRGLRHHGYSKIEDAPVRNSPHSSPDLHCIHAIVTGDDSSDPKTPNPTPLPSSDICVGVGVPDHHESSPSRAGTISPVSVLKFFEPESGKTEPGHGITITSEESDAVESAPRDGTEAVFCESDPVRGMHDNESLSHCNVAFDGCNRNGRVAKEHDDGRPNDTIPSARVARNVRARSLRNHPLAVATEQTSCDEWTAPAETKPRNTEETAQPNNRDNIAAENIERNLPNFSDDTDNGTCRQTQQMSSARNELAIEEAGHDDTDETRESTFHSASCSNDKDDGSFLPSRGSLVQITKGANRGNSGTIIDWRDKRTLRVRIAPGKIVGVRLSSIEPFVPREKPKKDPLRVSRPTTETTASVETPAQNPRCCDNSSTSRSKDGGGFPKSEQKVRIVAGVHKGKVGVFEKPKTKNTCWILLLPVCGSLDPRWRNGECKNIKLEERVAVRRSSIKILDHRCTHLSSMGQEADENDNQCPQDQIHRRCHRIPPSTTNSKPSITQARDTPAPIFSKQNNNSVRIVRGKHKGKFGVLCGKSRTGLYEILLGSSSSTTTSTSSNNTSSSLSSSRGDGGDDNSISPAGEQRVRVQKASVVFICKE